MRELSVLLSIFSPLNPSTSAFHPHCPSQPVVREATSGSVTKFSGCFSFLILLRLIDNINTIVLVFIYSLLSTSITPLFLFFSTFPAMPQVRCRFIFLYLAIKCWTSSKLQTYTVLNNLIRACGFRDNLHLWDLRIHIPNLSFALSTQLSHCLLHISTWVS